MKQIIDFCKRQYKLLIPLMVILALLITVFFLYKEYRYDNYRDKHDVAVYQYFGGARYDYVATVTYNLKKAIVDIKAKDKIIYYDATPIYYKDSDTVIFPHEMSIAFPLKQGSQYKLYKYSSYELKDDIKEIKTGTNVVDFDYFFLYDGDGLYFFPDEVTLQIDGKDYRKLGAMSYVILTDGSTLEYYDRESGTAEFLDIEDEKITVTSEYINVNLSDASFKALSSTVLLIPPTNLNAIK